MKLGTGAPAAKLGAITIGVRTEHCDISTSAGEWPARVRLAEHLGSDTFLYLEADGIGLADGGRIAAWGVIDAGGPDGPMPGIELAWQKFVGVEYAMPGHGLDAPIIMDTLVDQSDGYRFVYILPFAPDRLQIDDTYYTNRSALGLQSIRH